MTDTNFFARIGQDITDAELIEDYGLDPEKNIDKQMFDKMEKDNIQYYINQEGLTPDQAKKKAKAGRREKESSQRAILAQLNKK